MCVHACVCVCILLGDLMWKYPAPLKKSALNHFALLSIYHIRLGLKTPVWIKSKQETYLRDILSTSIWQKDTQQRERLNAQQRNVAASVAKPTWLAPTQTAVLWVNRTWSRTKPEERRQTEQGGIWGQASSHRFWQEAVLSWHYLFYPQVDFSTKVRGKCW